MEVYFLAILLVLNLILLFKVFQKVSKGPSENMLAALFGQKIAENNANFIKELVLNSQQMQKNQKEEFEFFRELVDNKLDLIDQKVQGKLEKGLEKTRHTFSQVIERLAKIDQAQKKIEELSGTMVGLNDILNDKKSRGIFGEVQLYQLLKNVFGQPRQGVYSVQKKLKNKLHCRCYA